MLFGRRFLSSAKLRYDLPELNKSIEEERAHIFGSPIRERSFVACDWDEQTNVHNRSVRIKVEAIHSPLLSRMGLQLHDTLELLLKVLLLSPRRAQVLASW